MSQAADKLKRAVAAALARGETEAAFRAARAPAPRPPTTEKSARWSPPA